MGVMIAPIIKGKEDSWKEWGKELTGARAAEMKDLNKRYGLKRHSAWFTNMPEGPAAVVLQEGPGEDTFMQKLAQSTNEFDVWFRGKVQEFHNMNLSQPSSEPLAKIYIDSTD